MSSCFSRCLRVPIAMRRFYEQSLWIPQNFLFTNLDLHHGLLSTFCQVELAKIVGVNRQLHSFPFCHFCKFPPRNQLNVQLSQNLAKLIAGEKMEIALPPS